MTRSDLARPIVIPKHSKDLSPRVLHSNLRTLGITQTQFEELLRDI